MICLEYTGNLYVEITNKCNLLCKHCYNTSNANNQLFISNEQFKIIIDSCKKNGINKIALSGGEPLLNPDIVQIIKAISYNNLECKIVTNATLINRDFLDSIKECPNVKFQISLHGSSEAIHESLSNVKSFSKIVSNIALLKEYGRHFSIKTIINKSNTDDIENVVNMCQNFGADGVSVSFLQYIGRALSNLEIGLSPTELTQFYINTLMPLYEKYNGFLTGPKISNTRCPLIFGGFDENRTYTLAPRVDTKGLVYPCSMFINERFSVGNIFESDLEIIFKGSSFINLMRYMELRENYVDKCYGCSVFDVCGKGCPASSMETDILSPNLYCNTVKWKILSDLVPQQ